LLKKQYKKDWIRIVFLEYGVSKKLTPAINIFSKKISLALPSLGKRGDGGEFTFLN
jgi:hypothetical protein